MGFLMAIISQNAVKPGFFVISGGNQRKIAASGQVVKHLRRKYGTTGPAIVKIFMSR